MSCRKCHGGGYRKNCENSLSLKTFADIAEWFLIAIQRESPLKNGFEADPKDRIPLNCNLPASKGTIQKFNEPVRIEPCKSLTNSRLLENMKSNSNAGFSRAHNGVAKIPSPHAASLSRRYP